jgi:hypothetical protein
MSKQFEKHTSNYDNVKVLWVSGTHINPIGHFNVNAGDTGMVQK